MGYPAEETAQLDKLYTELRAADAEEASRIEDEIWRLWSHSGSPSMDLLLERGRKALEQGDYEAALDHLTALTDHAPISPKAGTRGRLSGFRWGALVSRCRISGGPLRSIPGISGRLAALGPSLRRWSAPNRRWRSIAPRLLYIRICKGYRMR
ncbi:hypothetical protein ACFSHQ_20165 [Gemmobacter lanyuensis]